MSEEVNVPRIETLVDDIYGLLSNGASFTDEDYEALGRAVAHKVKLSLERSEEPPRLRMSNVGKGDKYLWYLMNTPPDEISSRSEEILGDRLLNFLYGDIVEEMVLWLAKKAGHVVTDEQKQITLEGVSGSCDCRIDGVGLDVKSASGFGFKKFSQLTVLEDDPYGYRHQINGYFRGDERKGWLAVNKETGHLCLALVNNKDLPDTAERIKEIREFSKLPNPPSEPCYPDIQAGTLNRKLSAFCKSCPFKDKCWSHVNNGKGLRKFKYAGEVEYLTFVGSEPRVPELDEQGDEIEKKKEGFAKINSPLRS